MAVEVGETDARGIGDNRDGCRDGVGVEVDDRDGAVAKWKRGRGRDAGQIGIAAVEDVRSGAILQNTNHDGVNADWNVGENSAEANRVDGIIGIAVGVAGLGVCRTERNADDAERAWIDTVTGIGNNHLVAGGGEVSPERRGADSDGVGGSGGDDVELVRLGVDDADGTVTLIEDEGAASVSGHDTVNGVYTDGDWCGVDRVARFFDGGYLSKTTAIALADGKDARSAGDTGHINRRKGRVDAEFLSQIERLAGELGDSVEAGVADVGAGSAGKDTDGIGAGEQRGLEDLALQELGADVKGSEGVVAVKRVTGVAAAVEDQVVGVDADLRSDEYGVAREVDEIDQPGGVWIRARYHNCELLWLPGWADRVDGADDGAIGVAATEERCHDCGWQGEPE